MARLHSNDRVDSALRNIPTAIIVACVTVILTNIFGGEPLWPVFVPVAIFGVAALAVYYVCVALVLRRRRR